MRNCSNHPIVNDLTGFSTYDVVHKVRCEAKQALTDHVNEKKWHRTALSIPTTQTKLAKAQKDLDGNVTRSQILADLDLIKLESEDNRKKLDAVTLRGEALVIRLDEIPKELKEARTKFEKLSAGTVTLDPARKQNCWAMKTMSTDLSPKWKNLPCRNRSFASG